MSREYTGFELQGLRLDVKFATRKSAASPFREGPHEQVMRDGGDLGTAYLQ
ncbi:MAG: hypothetical protein OXF88_18795 [Rhodobacteraceae bacterium]|nr:hypothetical protein [Paracoccaceae bacterium]